MVKDLRRIFIVTSFCHSLEVDQFNIKDQSCVGWNNSWNTSSSISVRWWAGKDCLLSLLELADAFIPSSDDFSLTNSELKWLSSRDAGIKYGAVGELSCVVNLDGGAWWAYWACTLVKLLNSELSCHNLLRNGLKKGTDNRL